MTWSIIARDPIGTLGIAIASRFFAVGALTMHTRAGAGLLSTQALMNPLYGPRGIELLSESQDAQAVVTALVQADPGRAHRQLHVLPVHGTGFAFTGQDCIDWCGHQVFEDFSVAGNMLAGPQVLQASADAFVENIDLPLAERLLAAMHAGQAAGGDKRGKQAAALRIHGAQIYPQLDLRVDDHNEPLRELQRLYDKSQERFQPFLTCLPTAQRPAGITERDAIEAAVAAFQAQRRAQGTQ